MSSLGDYFRMETLKRGNSVALATIHAIRGMREVKSDFELLRLYINGHIPVCLRSPSTS
jgi:hypothetical protein